MSHEVTMSPDVQPEPVVGSTGKRFCSSGISLKDTLAPSSALEHPQAPATLPPADERLGLGEANVCENDGKTACCNMLQHAELSTSIATVNAAHSLETHEPLKRDPLRAA